jgi:hypothetical protein
MKHIFYHLLFLVTAATVVCLQCSGTDVAGGGTIETTNGIVGLVYEGDSTPAANAIVKLFPDDYDPMSGEELNLDFIDTTDASGTYRFSRIPLGSYTVLVRNRMTVTSYLKRGIAVNLDSVITIPVGTLNRSGSITAEFSANEAAAGGYVYIPGTDIASQVAGNGVVVLSDVPSGKVPAVMLVNSSGVQQNVLRSEITVSGGETAIIEMPLWKYSCRLGLNTAPSGADVPGDVFDFPVLVRLDSSNFNFTQSRADGEDLVFIGSNGATLPREIERFDAIAQHAEVWVRVDTVRGNNSSQSIKMYWGNANATSVSDAGGVFDSSAGYLGVWHLSGNGNDASARKNNAVVCTPADVEGVIGIGKKFGGADSIKIASLLGQPQVVTLSAWAMLDNVLTGSKGAEIVSIGDGCLLRMDDTEENYFGVTGSYHLTGETSFYHVYSGRYLRNTGWHYCVVVFDLVNRTQTLYIDGTLSSRTASADSINYTGVGVNTFIGIHGNGKTNYQFIGTIDEVRVNTLALSEDRVKLEFMNQKSEDALVIFEK